MVGRQVHGLMLATSIFMPIPVPGGPTRLTRASGKDRRISELVSSRHAAPLSPRNGSALHPFARGSTPVDSIHTRQLNLN